MLTRNKLASLSPVTTLGAIALSLVNPEATLAFKMNKELQEHPEVPASSVFFTIGAGSTMVPKYLTHINIVGVESFQKRGDTAEELKTSIAKPIQSSYVELFGYDLQDVLDKKVDPLNHEEATRLGSLSLGYTQDGNVFKMTLRESNSGPKLRWGSQSDADRNNDPTAAESLNALNEIMRDVENVLKGVAIPSDATAEVKAELEAHNKTVLAIKGAMREKQAYTRNTAGAATAVVPPTPSATTDAVRNQLTALQEQLARA
jgi:hypothetical protein